MSHRHTAGRTDGAQVWDQILGPVLHLDPRSEPVHVVDSRLMMSNDRILITFKSISLASSGVRQKLFGHDAGLPV